MANERPDRNWVTFTRRTEDPKLAWIERELDKRGIPHRRDGRSFHAPILQVWAESLDDAWEVLPFHIDELPDDDLTFE